MSDTFVTLHGWVGSDVSFREPHGISVVTLRVASTPRLKREGKWIDGETTWYSVTAWRHLADNIHKAVKKGDAVIVHGRLRTDSWKREDGQLSSSLQIEASLVGHDLTRGTSVFLRTPKPERTDRQDAEAVQEAEELMRAEQEQAPVDGWGNVRDGEQADDHEGSSAPERVPAGVA